MLPHLYPRELPMAQLLFIDTETGGFDPKNDSILSLGAVVWQDGKFLGKFEVYVREPTIQAAPEALAVNKIDLAWLEANGKAPAVALAEFEAFLNHHFPPVGDKLTRVTLAGHNLNFDLGFIKRLYEMGGGKFGKRFASRVMDTSGVMAFLMLTGKLPSESPTTDFGFNHFGIAFAAGERHSALADCVATAQLFNHLIALDKGETVVEVTTVTVETTSIAR